MLQMTYIAEMSKDRQREALKAAEADRLVQAATTGAVSRGDRTGRPSFLAWLLAKAASILNGTSSRSCEQPSLLP
jgi:hypothetical protein